MDIKAIIGLGNPGRNYQYNRHNIGFRVVDALCSKYGGIWRNKDMMELAEITIKSQKIMLIKPQTFMNESGKVIPFLQKQGIKAENIVVVHDELELPFGTIKLKIGGSAKGHNGLKSLIEYCGQDFARLRFGIGRPTERSDVPSYVLHDFTQQEATVLIDLIEASVSTLEDLFN